MGGTAANRLSGLALAAVRGAQSLTLDITQLPAHSHPASAGNDSPDHAHNIPPHSHGGITTTNGGHQHNYVAPHNEPASGAVGGSQIYRHRIGAVTDYQGDHYHGIPAEALGTYGATARHSHSISIGNTGSGAAVPTVQPTIALNMIIKL